MADDGKKFHEFALKSILFKGRTDWYFCYLKSERISHVLWIIQKQVGEGRVEELATRASELPGAVAYMAAGESEVASVLADVFALLAEIRAAVSEQLFSREIGAVICKEYEEIAQRLVAGSHPSPFVTADDFRITPLPEFDAPLHPRLDIKDSSPRQLSDKQSDSEPSERMSLILDFIRKNKRSSIKDIAAVVKGCSEKTIQRELGSLIERGLVRKVGERRWSVYLPA